MAECGNKIRIKKQIVICPFYKDCLEDEQIEKEEKKLLLK